MGIDRRQASWALMGTALLAGSDSPAQTSPVTNSKTFVLAHGSWHGGWCWSRVAARLRQRGHVVFAPSFTGMGDRAHLLSKDITIGTFVNDLVGVIESEELTDVVLVGHSFGGVSISGVADRIPTRLRQLVYLDAVVLESGITAFSAYPPEEAAARIKAAEAATGGLAVPVPAKLPAGWGLIDGSADHAWVTRRLTPHPLQTYLTALQLSNPIGNGIQKTYIDCTAGNIPGLPAMKNRLKDQGGWQWHSIKAPHDAMVTHADALADLLNSIANR